jgi:hypothetical protein
MVEFRHVTQDSLVDSQTNTVYTISGTTIQEPTSQAATWEEIWRPA